MTLKACVGIPAGIDDELLDPTAPTHRNVLAAGAMTGFATRLAGLRGIFYV